MHQSNPSTPGLRPPKTAKELLDLYLLDMRSALLETAAAMDRIQRAENGNEILAGPRVQQLIQGLEILKSKQEGRAERFLRLLSDPVKG